jgi:hypothetical protein
MTDKPGDLDPPHPELPTQTPLIFDLKMGDVLYRHHQIALDPIYFGTTGKNRFDDPDCPAGQAVPHSSPHSSLVPLAQGGPKQTVEVGRFSMPKPART